MKECHSRRQATCRRNLVIDSLLMFACSLGEHQQGFAISELYKNLFNSLQDFLLYHAEVHDCPFPSLKLDWWNFMSSITPAFDS